MPVASQINVVRLSGPRHASAVTETRDTNVTHRWLTPGERSRSSARPDRHLLCPSVTNDLQTTILRLRFKSWVGQVRELYLVFNELLML